MQDQINLAQKVVGITARVLLGLYFIMPGISKVTGFGQTSDAMAAHGVPLVPVLLVLTIIMQIGGGIALAIGYRTQLMAFLLAGLTLVISLFMHDFWNLSEGLEQAHEMQNFIKNMAIMAGLMFVAAASLDHQRAKLATEG